MRSILSPLTRAAVAACASVVVLALIAGGAVAKPTSHAEALAQGDPAATAPSFSEDVGGAVYKGKQVSGKTILENKLACLAVDLGPDRCYSSVEAMEAAEVEPPLAGASKARGKRGPRANAAVCGTVSLLVIWTGADWTGAAAGLEDRFRWANLRAEVDNEGSSFHMGDYSGHLAENQNGGGYWYPGSTIACAVEDNLNRNGSGWNNRISSRYRN